MLMKALKALLPVKDNSNSLHLHCAFQIFVGLAQNFVRVFHKVLWKSPNALFGQPNNYYFHICYLSCTYSLSTVRVQKKF